MTQSAGPQSGGHDPLERRHDAVTAALIEVALIYKRVFSPAACIHYLALCEVKGDTVARILNDHHRHPLGGCRSNP